MTALEILYNQTLEKKMPFDRFYDTFRDGCPTTFFRGLKCLNDTNGSDDVDLCCKCWLQEVNTYHMIDEIFLLSIDEYKKYIDAIPVIEAFWWLRSPGAREHNASCICRNGSIDVWGAYVSDGWIGVRPALTITDCAFANLRVGDRYVKYDFPWIKIDDILAIAEVPIGFNRFAIKSNDYEESEVRQYILNWVKSRKGAD